ncbi:hypothetical protein P171DRAFT_426309 [Karstenula rhodostoma CBS 690.94]|uniref:Uncharacterized protein n=1 Tax=Karstenula rhodostoma CBS 690.94 TaxID=1392251 RepID=A0A9P4PX52_9PLEO|nr:hypothetical protein P171DRAFT_426309 [Karstenula rhodostoma CBS 690.94]
MPVDALHWASPPSSDAYSRVSRCLRSASSAYLSMTWSGHCEEFYGLASTCHFPSCLIIRIRVGSAKTPFGLSFFGAWSDHEPSYSLRLRCQWRCHGASDPLTLYRILGYSRSACRALRVEFRPGFSYYLGSIGGETAYCFPSGCLPVRYGVPSETTSCQMIKRSEPSGYNIRMWMW